MRNKLPLTVREQLEWIGAEKIPLNKGNVTRCAESIDELVESVAAGVTGGSKTIHLYNQTSLIFPLFCISIKYKVSLLIALFQ